MRTIALRMGSASSTMSDRAASMISEHSSPLHELQDLYSEFYLKCRGCAVHISFDDLKPNIDEWSRSGENGPIQELPCPSAIHCKSCSTLTCMGCGRKPHKNNVKTIIASETVNICCEEGRLLCIWLVLCHFDDKELELQAKAPKAVPKASNSIRDNGVGYEQGYYGALISHPAEKPIQKEALEALGASDQRMMATLVLLTRLLSKQAMVKATPDTKDELILFRMSILLDRVCALVRNDSISDLSKQSDLYYPLFSFLEIIAYDPRLAQLLFEPQLSRSGSPGLRALSEASNNGKHSFNITGDQSPSVFTCFNLTYKQAKAFLDISKKIKRDKSKLRSGPDPTDMCNTIIKLYSVLEDKVAQLISNSSPLQEIKDPWTAFSEKNRVTFTDDILKSHRYSKAFPSLRGSSRDRMLVIGREISTLTTSLPAGVFVKVAESRADVMKVLIIGVEGSPYAGGIFIFDLLLPQTYPNVPPKMAFVLEGADDESPSMNPNLHYGGAICLSILNTWSGDETQMWQPRKSTLLAVLVSIQAMILGAPLPWLNEPGMSSQTPRAMEHKLRIQVKTIRHAMIAWLRKIKQPKENDKPDVWQDIVEVYWERNHQNIRETVEKWSLENPRIEKHDKSVSQMANPERLKQPVKEVDHENLLETLKTLIDMKQPKAIEPNAHDSSKAIDGCPLDSSIGKGSNEKSIGDTTEDSTKGKRKRSAGNKESKGSKRQKVEDTETDSESEAVGDKWVYTGSRKLKDVRAACHEFDIKPARNILISISRLEEHVNENVELDAELALKYGEVESLSD